MDINTKVGKRLKELRESKHIKQKDLANTLDITQTSISRYEAGTSDPTLHALLAYADYFNVSLDYIFDRTEMPEETVTKDNSEEIAAKFFDPNSEVHKKLDELIKSAIKEELK